MQKISKLIATLFFTGYFPFAPGTLASLLAVALCILLKDFFFIYFLLTLSSLILGFWSSSRSEKDFPQKDPPQIIIDEFSSMLLVFLFIPFRPKFLIMGFLLFRIFDIFKIPSLNGLQRLPARFGIMLDDIAAAILANLVLQVLRFL